MYLKCCKCPEGQPRSSTKRQNIPRGSMTNQHSQKYISTSNILFWERNIFLYMCILYSSYCWIFLLTMCDHKQTSSNDTGRQCCIQDQTENHLSRLFKISNDTHCFWTPPYMPTIWAPGTYFIFYMLVHHILESTPLFFVYTFFSSLNFLTSTVKFNL